MSHRTTHSFEITISDILRQRVDSLAQWLEHWISTLAVRVRIPFGTWDFFQTMHRFLVTNFHIRKNSDHYIVSSLELLLCDFFILETSKVTKTRRNS